MEKGKHLPEDNSSALYQRCHGQVFVRTDPWRKPHPQPARPLIASAHARIPAKCVEEALGLESQSRSHLSVNFDLGFVQPLLVRETSLSNPINAFSTV